MKLLKTCALALAVTTSLPIEMVSASDKLESKQNHSFGTINAQRLDALLSSKTPVALIDARTAQYFDGTVIPGASWLPADAADAKILKTLPNKSKLVVVYCGGGACPASANLANRLVSLGYKNVVEYPGGMSEWKALNKPTQKVDS